MSERDTRGTEDSACGPLECEWCGKDLLDTVGGGLVQVQERREFMPHPRYVEVYSWCKVPCQEEALSALGLDRWTTHYKSIDDAANPLEYPRWVSEISRLIERGSFSTPAAKKLSEAKRAIAWVAVRKPTVEDIIRFRQIRKMHGL